MRPARIPLFPLEVVLLPGMSVPLHIFEPRYKSMIGRCLKEGIEFGIVLAQHGSAVAVGCTAEITRKIRDYSDGRMDIIADGRAIFRIIDLLNEKEYHEAIVDYLPEDATPQDGQKERELVEIFQECHLLLFGHQWPGSEPRDPIPLAYRMAARLPLGLRERQQMLEERNELARREFLHKYSSELLPKLAQNEIAKQQAMAKGQGVH
ncbi:MAG TPA: LON peptidase substrate-binding domain-containing protein [Candidatus Acidoferrales bacterium]|nr:LON peptidase substrate-binding domain-containing protein [Candidatus Acidoferrales bacterium]